MRESESDGRGLERTDDVLNLRQGLWRRRRGIRKIGHANKGNWETENTSTAQALNRWQFLVWIDAGER